MLMSKLALLIDHYSEADWKENVIANGMEDEYGLEKVDEDGNSHDEEIKKNDLVMPDDDELLAYTYMGSATESESFYAVDVQIFQRKSDGSLWVKNSDVDAFYEI